MDMPTTPRGDGKSESEEQEMLKRVFRNIDADNSGSIDVPLSSAESCGQYDRLKIRGVLYR